MIRASTPLNALRSSTTAIPSATILSVALLTFSACGDDDPDAGGEGAGDATGGRTQQPSTGGRAAGTGGASAVPDVGGAGGADDSTGGRPVSTVGGSAGSGEPGAAGNAGAGGAPPAAGGDGGNAGAGGAADSGTGGDVTDEGVAGSSGAGGEGSEDEPCPPGYELTIGGCEDENECARPRSPCGGTSVCQNTVGGFTCECGPGSVKAADGGCVSLCAPRDFDGASTVLSIGHVDLIAAAFDERTDELQVFVSDDTLSMRDQPLKHTPASVLVHGKPAAEFVVPDVPALNGVLTPGSTLWLLPEGQPEAHALGLVWPGFQSYGVASGVFVDDRIVVRLLDHEGSGRFLAFGSPQDEVTPPEILFDTATGADETDFYAGVHRHMNWGFEQGGLHRLSIELEGTTPGSQIVTSQAHTYRFFFGELSNLPSTERAIVVPEGLSTSYPRGAALTLTAARYGMPSGLPTAWARQCLDLDTSEVGRWEALGGGDELQTTAEFACQYVACLMNGSTVAAISQAVSPAVE